MNPLPRSSGLGTLLQTDYEHVDLGVHGDRALRARVRRRMLRLAFGRGCHIAVTLGQTRPEAIEVIDATGRYDILVPAQADPWVRAGWRLALLWAASVVLVRLVRTRSTRSGGRS